MVSAMILMSLEVIEFSYIQGLNSSIDYRVGIIRGSAFPSELSQLSSFQGLFLLPSPATAGSVWQAKATTLMGVDNGRLPDIEPVPVTGLAANFSPIPRMAPPPLGNWIDCEEGLAFVGLAWS
jgi:hypothetical protein